MLYFVYGLPWKYAEMKKEMAKYLEERYLDQFTLEEVSFDFMHGKSYYTNAKAHSTGVTIYVERSGDGTFENGYSEHWSNFAEPLIKPYIPVADSISANVTFKKPLPDAKEVLDHLQHTWWDVYIDMPYSLTDINKDIELNKLLETIQQMDTDGIKFEYLLVGYMGDYVELHKEDLKGIQQTKKLEVVDYDVWTH